MTVDGKDTLLKIGQNGDIIKCWLDCYNRFKDQPREIVQDIRRIGSVNDRCEAIFGYLCNHVKYKEDERGYQWIKSPGRLLRDGIGDCKSLTLFVASCLNCCGIPCIVRFVNFDGGSQYTHVYPVAIDENGNEIIMDMCETDEQGVPYFDYARPYKKKKEFVFGL